MSSFKNFDFGSRGPRPLTGKSLIVKEMAEKLGYVVIKPSESELSGYSADKIIGDEFSDRELMEAITIPAAEHSVTGIVGMDGGLLQQIDRARTGVVMSYTNASEFYFDETRRYHELWKKHGYIHDDEPVNNSKYATPPSKRNRNHPTQDQSFNARRK